VAAHVENRKENPEAPALPLDVAERIVSFRDERGVLRKHVFTPPRQKLAEVREFFQQAHDEMLNSARKPGSGRDLAKPRRALYRALIIRVEGYTLTGGRPLAELPGWIERLPLAHRLAAVNLLTGITRAERAAEIDPEFDLVELDADWNGARPETTTAFSGLLHRFQPFSEEDLHEFQQRTTRVTEVKGTREPAFLQAAPEKVMLDFYDQKIRAVEGYAVGQQPLADAEQIRAWMDPFHKITALGPLVREHLEQGAAPDAAPETGEAEE